MQIGEAFKVARLQRSEPFVGYIQRSDAVELSKIGDLVVFSDAGQLTQDGVSHFCCSSVKDGVGAVHGALRRRSLRHCSLLSKDSSQQADSQQRTDSSFVVHDKCLL